MAAASFLPVANSVVRQVYRQALTLVSQPALETPMRSNIVPTPGSTAERLL
jgi:hypothetical protein